MLRTRSIKQFANLAPVSAMRTFKSTPISSNNMSSRRQSDTIDMTHRWSLMNGLMWCKFGKFCAPISHSARFIKRLRVLLIKRREFLCVFHDLSVFVMISQPKMQHRLNKSLTCIRTRTKSKTKTNPTIVTSKTIFTKIVCIFAAFCAFCFWFLTKAK